VRQKLNARLLHYPTVGFPEPPAQKRTYAYLCWKEVHSELVSRACDLLPPANKVYFRSLLPTSTDLLPKLDFQLCFNAISPNSERDGSSGRSAPKCTPKIINCVYRFTRVCKDYVAFHNPSASGCLIGID
jgi:hypothetical protein